ncbi:hypothetical protein Riv7116_4652 [Rivularia sp. PCC 7116]|uniref:hypothetical protein n=1 Tax=Rivularia sp. PCC 7116 TaxID=373994 RepID=UPI00029F1F35|nr:hypothetical protein [Rivularia sp. PCC 7116]AFY57071.1 hypothetical protein Riv7116_4652 [Rivularia sp. PCC 7116]
MVSDRINRQRLKSLEEILEIEYEKLSEFQKEIKRTSYFKAKLELQQEIKTEIIPDIRKHEAEYGQILSQLSEVSTIPENEAENTLAEIVQVVEHIEVLPAETYSNEMIQLLREIREKLDEPGKTAAAKLKVAFPIIPMLASYEMEMDTEATFTNLWQWIKSRLRDRV